MRPSCLNDAYGRGIGGLLRRDHIQTTTSSSSTKRTQGTALDSQVDAMLLPHTYYRVAPQYLYFPATLLMIHHTAEGAELGPREAGWTLECEAL